MKKTIGTIVMLIGCSISAVDLGRMILGRAYGWDNILGGLIISILCWMFLIKSTQGLLLNIAKSVGCIAAILAVLLLVNGGRQQASMGSSDDYPPQDPAFEQTTVTAPVGKSNSSSTGNTCSHCGGSGMCDHCVSGECESCFGEGEIWCESCLGSGSCPSCDGMGGEKHYVVGGDNRWITCSRCGGSGQCKRCDGIGSTTCSYCHGTGSCAHCYGTGDCAYCHGTGIH